MELLRKALNKLSKDQLIDLLTEQPEKPEATQELKPKTKRVRKYKRIPYPAEFKTWMANVGSFYTNRQIVREAKKKFNINTTPSRIAAYRFTHKLMTPRKLKAQNKTA